MPDWLSRTGARVTTVRTALDRRFIARRCDGHCAEVAEAVTDDEIGLGGGREK